jgi:hypothetical protein
MRFRALTGFRDAVRAGGAKDEVYEMGDRSKSWHVISL